MTQTNSFFPQTDPIVARRRALAKVYALLIRLAEEAEAKRKIASENLSGEKEEKIADNTPACEDESSQ